MPRTKKGKAAEGGVALAKGTRGLYRIVLELEDIAGGFPSSLEGYQTYLQAGPLVRGVAPPIKERFLEEVEQAMAKNEEPSKESEPGIVRTGFRMENGHPVIGAYQVKAMLQQATDTLYDRASSPTRAQISNAVKLALNITPSLIPLEGGSAGGVVNIAQIIQHPRNPSIRVPVQRRRDTWIGGTLSFEAEVAPGVNGTRLGTVLKDLFEAGGTFVGLGTDRGYGHGRFAVKEFRLA